MDQNLISKKELLDLTGISYGQLYRWKRKNLIPESWFIKKSSFTGQETFFPKADILVRIEKIKNMKDDVQLDDLAGLFSPMPTTIKQTGDALVEHNIVASHIFELLKLDVNDIFSFKEILFIFIIDSILNEGAMSAEESQALFQLLTGNAEKMSDEPWQIIFCRKRGIAVMLLLKSGSEYFLEDDLKIIYKADLQKFIEELKTKLNYMETI